MQIVKAPWNKEQIEALIRYQVNDDTHPYTCSHGHLLIPTENGWVCSLCPDYKQDWCLFISLTY